MIMLVIVRGHLTDHVLLEKSNDHIRMSMSLPEEEQKQLIRWFWENRAGWVREIVCEECPEHMG